MCVYIYISYTHHQQQKKKCMLTHRQTLRHTDQHTQMHKPLTIEEMAGVAHVCICMYVCMYVCMYACMHAFMHGWMDGCVYTHMYFCICIYMFHTRTHAHIPVGDVSNIPLTGILTPGMRLVPYTWAVLGKKLSKVPARHQEAASNECPGFG